MSSNNAHKPRTIHGRAVSFAMDKILHSTGWQQVQDLLSNHDEFGPWLEHEHGMAEAQAIIRQAEERLGNRLPANYA